MGILFNGWFPAGALPGQYSQLTCNNVLYASPSPTTLALPDVRSRCELVKAPDGSGETVLRMTRFVADERNPNGAKTQLTPGSTTVSPVVYDPITNWSGSTDGVLNANSRRWYRFKMMLPVGYQFEEWSVPPGKQCAVYFQIHDRADTSPQDAEFSPTMWLIGNPDGTHSFNVSSATATQTTGANFTVRQTATFRFVPGVPVEFVIYAKWAFDATGALKIWKDRRLVWDESGVVNTYNNDPARGGGGNMAMITCYTNDDAYDRTIYHWGLQIGDQAYSTYNQFAAACGAGAELERVMLRGSL